MTGATALFFYGTLRHRPLLELVLGPDGGAGLRLSDAELPGYEACWVVGESFPIICVSEGGSAVGLLAEGLSAEDVARLDFYEGGYLYDLAPVPVRTPEGVVSARVYFPAEGAWDAGEPFSLEDWEERWAEVTRHAAIDYMSLYGRVPAGEAARRYPRMRARAWSRMIAGATSAPSVLRDGPGAGAVRIHDRQRRHDGFFALDEVHLSHPAFAGGEVEITREVFLGNDAALVLLYDPHRDRVALLEQFRAGPLMRHDAQPWMLEPVAGLIDPGESPADCARREALEETGIPVGTLVPVMSGYPSPGLSSEFFHTFVGLCDLDGQGGGQSGIASEGEDIRTHVLMLDEALALVGTGEINVVPLAMLLFWTAARRQELRALA